MDLPPSREPSPSYEPVKIASISLYSNRTHFRATDKSFFDSSQLKLYHAFVTGVSLGEICKKVTQYLQTRTHTHTPHTCTHTHTHLHIHTHTLLYTHTHTQTLTQTPMEAHSKLKTHGIKVAEIPNPSHRIIYINMSWQ